MRVLNHGELAHVSGGTLVVTCPPTDCDTSCPPPPTDSKVHSKNGKGNGEEGLPPPGNSGARQSKFGNASTDAGAGR